MSLFVFLMALVSCQGEKEDEALREKHIEQRATIDALETEVREVRTAIEEIKVPDDFPDVSKLKLEVREVVKKRKSLEKEIRDLDAKKQKAIADFENYKQNYPIR